MRNEAVAIKPALVRAVCGAMIASAVWVIVLQAITEPPLSALITGAVVLILHNIWQCLRLRNTGMGISHARILIGSESVYATYRPGLLPVWDKIRYQRGMDSDICGVLYRYYFSNYDWSLLRNRCQE